MSGGNRKRNHRIERERLICRAEEQSAPEARASAAPRRGGGAAATLEGAAASDRPPTVRPASGGGMFGAHGKITYLSLPFCALMRQHGRLLRLGLRHRRSDPIVIR